MFKDNYPDAQTPFGGWLGLRGYEGRGKLRYASGKCKQLLIRGYPNGNSYQSSFGLLMFHSMERETSGRKHLSRRAKRNQMRFP